MLAEFRNDIASDVARLWLVSCESSPSWWYVWWGVFWLLDFRWRYDDEAHLFWWWAAFQIDDASLVEITLIVNNNSQQWTQTYKHKNSIAHFVYSYSECCPIGNWNLKTMWWRGGALVYYQCCHCQPSFVEPTRHRDLWCRFAIGGFGAWYTSLSSSRAAKG